MVKSIPEINNLIEEHNQLAEKTATLKEHVQILTNVRTRNTNLRVCQP